MSHLSKDGHDFCSLTEMDSPAGNGCPDAVHSRSPARERQELSRLRSPK